MNMPLLTYIKEISPRPVLIIAGEKRTHDTSAKMPIRQQRSRKSWLSFLMQLTWIYMIKLDVIPFEKMEKFFNENLKVESGVKASAELVEGQ